MQDSDSILQHWMSYYQLSQTSFKEDFFARWDHEDTNIEPKYQRTIDQTWNSCLQKVLLNTNEQHQEFIENLVDDLLVVYQQYFEQSQQEGSTYLLSLTFLNDIFALRRYRGSKHSKDIITLIMSATFYAVDHSIQNEDFHYQFELYESVLSLFIVDTLLKDERHALFEVGASDFHKDEFSLFRSLGNSPNVEHDSRVAFHVNKIGVAILEGLTWLFGFETDEMHRNADNVTYQSNKVSERLDGNECLFFRTIAYLRYFLIDATDHPVLQKLEKIASVLKEQHEYSYQVFDYEGQAVSFLEHITTLQQTPVNDLDDNEREATAKITEALNGYTDLIISGEPLSRIFKKTLANYKRIMVMNKLHKV